MSLLLHGPGAKEEALERAEALGRLMAPPFGEDGLKTDQAREIAGLLRSRPLRGRGVVIIGPMDNIPVSAADALLKPLEEVNTEVLQPILWAMDAGNVLSTIRSRCIEEWCPFGPDPEGPFMEAAVNICKAAMKREWARVIEILKAHEKDDKAKREDQTYELMMASAAVLAKAKGDNWFPLWNSLREALRYKHLSKNEVLAAYMGNAHG